MISLGVNRMDIKNVKNNSSIEKSLELQKEAEACIMSLDENNLRCNYFIEAGAGSGKTFLLTERIVNLVASGMAKIDEICAITFTKRMAEEFVARLKCRFEDKMKTVFSKESQEYDRCLKSLNYLNARTRYNDLNGCFLGTIDSFCYQFIKKYQNEEFDGVESINKGFKVEKNDNRRISESIRDIDEADMAELGKDIYVKGLKLFVKNEDLELAKYGEGKDDRYDNYVNSLRTAKTTYDTKKKEEGIYSFQDIMYRVRAILKSEAENNGGELINDFIDSTKKKFFFLDEFQDTSPIQAEIFFYLTHTYKRNGSTSVQNWRDCKPKPGSIFIVGDPKQSIYHFRGADVYSYQEVKNLFLENNIGKVLYLTVNRRSTRKLIEAFNASFDDIFNKETLGKLNICFNCIPSLEQDINKEEKALLDGVYVYDAYCGKKYTDDSRYKFMTNEAMIAQIIATIVDNEDYKIKIRRDKNGPEIIDKIRYEDICVIQYSRKNLKKTAAYLDDKKIDNYLLVKKETQEEMLQAEKALINQDDVDIEAYSIEEEDTIEAGEYKDFWEKEIKSNVLTQKDNKDKVWLTTIHTSKGDEKPIVILGYSWPVKFKTSSVRDEKNSEWHISGFYDWNGKASIENPAINSEEMKALLDKEESIQNQEFKNLIYVAATRAKNALFICDSKTAAIENKNRWSWLIKNSNRKMIDINRGREKIDECSTIKAKSSSIEELVKQSDSWEECNFGEQGTGII